MKGIISVGILSALGCLLPQVHGLEGLTNSISQELQQDVELGICSRLFTRDGMIGCNTERDGNEGVIFQAENQNELDGLFGDTSTDLFLLVPDALLTVENVKKAEEVGHISGILIYETEESYQSNPSSKNEFNPSGTGLSDLAIAFPVAFVRNETRDSFFVYAAENKELGKDAKQAHNVKVEAYMGPISSSVDCLERSQFEPRRCDPIGGYSIVSSVGKVVDSRDTVLVATGLDSTAFFHDLSFGANAGASGIVAVLAAVASFKPQVEAIAGLEKQILFGLFQGEAYGLMGSARFMDTVKRGCEVYRLSQGESLNSCYEPTPTYSLDWEPLNNATFSSVIVVEQVLSESFSAHATGQQGDAVATTIVDNSAGTVSTVDPKVDIPPQSTANTFASLATGTVLISGNQKEFPTNFHSKDDRFSGTDDDLKKIVDNLSGLALTLAKSSLALAAGPGDTIPEVTIDNDLVTDLVNCFYVDFACDLVASYLNVTTEIISNVMDGFPAGTSGVRNGPLPLFTSTYEPFRGEGGQARPLEQFVRNFLATQLVPDISDDVETKRCGNDVVCQQDCSIIGARYNTTGACISQKCTCSVAFFHDAFSPGIIFDLNEEQTRFDWVVDEDASLEAWTEPKWSVSFTVHRKPDLVGSIIMVVFGVLISVGSFFLSRFATRSSNTKIKIA